MPLIGVILNPGNTGANVRELHKQLLAAGAVIAPGEQTATNYGPSTVAGDAVDLSTGRLMHVASAFAGTGGREGLRAAVREAASAADTSQPQEPHGPARCATISGREFDLEADEAVCWGSHAHPSFALLILK